MLFEFHALDLLDVLELAVPIRRLGAALVNWLFIILSIRFILKHNGEGALLDLGVFVIVDVDVGILRRLLLLMVLVLVFIYCVASLLVSILADNLHH